MKEFIDRIKSYFKNDGQDLTKKRIQNLTIFMAIGIILLIAGGVFSKERPTDFIDETDLNAKELTEDNQSKFDQYDEILEGKIKGILSQIDGVGKVEIALTYQSGEEIVPAKDTSQNESNTKEQDIEGGVRSTIQMDTDSKVIIGNQSEISPVILKVIPPQVKGVIVVAEGANSDIIKIDISKAVSTLLGISLSKVEVFPMNN